MLLPKRRPFPCLLVVLLLLLACAAGLAGPQGSSPSVRPGARVSPNLLRTGRRTASPRARASAYRPNANSAANVGRPDLVWLRGGNHLEVPSVAYSPDGTLIASGSGSTPHYEANVKLWRVSDGMLLRTINQHGGYCNSIQFSPNGQTLAATEGPRSTGAPYSINFYQVPDGTLSKTFQAPGPINSLAFSPDGQFLASGDGLNVRLWRLSDGSSLTLAGHTGTVNSVAFSAGGQVLASASGLGTDKIVRLWNIPSGTLAGTLTSGIVGNGYQVAFFGQDQFVAVGEVGGLLRVFRLADGQEMRSMRPATDTLRRFALADSAGLVSLTSGTRMEVRRLSDGTLLGTAPLAGSDAFLSLAFAPDSKSITTGGRIGFDLQSWRVPDLAPAGNLTAGALGPAIVAVSADGQWVASAGTRAGYLVLRRGSDGSVVRDFNASAGYALIRSLALSPDGRFLAADTFTEAEQKIRVWSVPDGRPLLTLPGTWNGGSVAFSPDGQILAGITSTGEQLWHMPDGAPVTRFAETGIPVFSPDGAYIVITGSLTALYRVSDPSNRLLGISGGPAVAFSPDSKSLAVSQRDYLGLTWVEVRNVPSTTVEYRIDTSSSVTSVAFSPDGQVLTTAQTDSRLNLWSATDGSLLASYNQETGGSEGIGSIPQLDHGVTSVAYTGDGKYLLYGRQDGTVAEALNPLTKTITPDHGGNTGDVTVRVVLPENVPTIGGADLELTAPGQPSILGNGTSAIADHTLVTTFNLQGAALGVRDLTVTVQSVGRVTFPHAFTVEVGNSPQLITDIVAPRKVRGGTLRLYNLVVRNAGNIDSPATTLGIAFSTLLAWVPTSESDRLSQIDLIRTDYEEVRLFDLPPVAANGFAHIAITLLPTSDARLAHSSLEVEAWTNSVLSGQPEEPLARISRLHNPRGSFDHQEQSNDGIRYSAFDIATVAHNAGFRCKSLEIAIAVVLAESGGYIHEIDKNEDADNNVLSTDYGLWQFNDKFSPVSITVSQALDPVTSSRKAFQASRGGAYFRPWYGFTSLNYRAYMPIAEVQAQRWEDECAHHDGELVFAGDPNDLSGVAGFGQAHWTAGAQPLVYSVFFSNEADASAPTANAIVVDHLELGKVTIESVQPGAISFAGRTVTPKLANRLGNGARQYTAEVDLRPSKNVNVQINISLDMLAGELTWKFISLDPITGRPPDDPLAGFLDPGAEASCLFSAMPQSGSPTGTVVRDVATVVFDANPPMDTPTWFNTLDNDLPVSVVHSMPATQTAADFPVSWSGSDSGAGVRNFTISVSDNGGVFVPWLVNTTDTDGIYHGISGHTYAFFSTAQDNAGNVEPIHSSPDVLTEVAVLNASPPTTTVALTGTQGNNGWYTGPVQVRLSATDPDGAADVANTYYSVDSGAQQTYTSPFTVTGDAVHTVSFWSVDQAGNEETPHRSVTIKIDGTLPTLTFGTPSPSPNGAGWSNTAVDIPYTTSDNLSGVASAAPGSPLHFDTSGKGQSQTVTVTDAAGNSATFTSPAVNIDKTAPATSASLSGTTGKNGWYVGPVTVTLSASDALSGVAATYYTLDGGAPQPYGAPVMIAADGSHSVTFWSVDQAGNTEATHGQSIRIDQTPPVVAITSPTARVYYNTGGPIGVSFTASDNLDPSPAVSTTLDGSAFTGSSISVASLALGDHTLAVTAADAAGNTRTQQVTFQVQPQPLAAFAVSDVSIHWGPKNAKGKGKPVSFHVKGVLDLPAGVTPASLSGDADVLLEIGGRTGTGVVLGQVRGTAKGHLRGKRDLPPGANMSIEKLKINWSKKDSRPDRFLIEGDFAPDVFDDGSGVVTITLLLPVRSGGDLEGSATVQCRIAGTNWVYHQ